MLFNSLAFFVFFGVVWAVYALLPHRAQNRWLLAASYFFYGAWDWRFLGLILISTVVSYVAALGMQRSANARQRKAWVTASVVVDLALLGVFKYTGFFAEIANALLGTGFSVQGIVLPLAISFFTFQQIAYLVDAYKGEVTDSGFLNYCLFVSFFPQLIAGPIVHHKELMPQFREDRIFHFLPFNLAMGSGLS